MVNVVMHAARAAGDVFAAFERLQSLPRPQLLVDVFPGFHDMWKRLVEFDQVLRDDRVGRSAQVADEVAAIQNGRAGMEGLQQAIDALQRRVCHSDTKLDDFLFDASVDVVALVDIDAVRPEAVMTDFATL